jgi:hypothetical protein
VAATGDGEWEIAEFDQDADVADDAELRVAVRAAGDGGAADRRLADKFRALGTPALRQAVRTLVAELRER